MGAPSVHIFCDANNDVRIFIKPSKLYPKTKCVILSLVLEHYRAAIIKSRYHDLWTNVKLSYSTSTWTWCPTQFILKPLFYGITKRCSYDYQCICLHLHINKPKEDDD